MASKANNVMELKPSMTKAKALQLVLNYVKDHGYPEFDVILDGNIENDKGSLKMINEWTFNGLCKFLTES